MDRLRSSALDAARAGDREGLSELWRTHQARLLRYFRARGMESPEDLASQVWIDVVVGLDRFEGDEDDFPRWLFTVAHRRGVDAVRRAVRTSRAPVDAVDHAPGADVEHDRNDALDRAVGLVSSLPDSLAEAVMLRVVNDLPIGAVADIMGTTEGNVRVLVHRGVARLRRKLAVTPRVRSTMKKVS